MPVQHPSLRTELSVSRPLPVDASEGNQGQRNFTHNIPSFHPFHSGRGIPDGSGEFFITLIIKGLRI